MNTLLILLIFLSDSGQVQQDLKPHLFRQWKTKDGLPQNTLFDVLQDKEGSLWLSSQEGLCRFDGQRFSLLNKRTHPTWPGQVFSPLYLARDRTLWAGTIGTGLISKSLDSWSSYPRPGGLSGVTVRAFAEDRDGILWMGTYTHGLLRQQDEAFVPYQNAELGDLKAIRTLAFDAFQNLWIGTPEGLFVLDPRQDTVLAARPDWHVNAMLEVNGGIVIATEHHCYVLAAPDQEPGAPWPLPEGESPTALWRDRQGGVWVGTQRGLWFFPEKGKRPLSVVLPRPMAIRNGICDEEGTVWLATQGEGLIQLCFQKYGQLLGAQSGLIHEDVWTICQDQREEQLYCGTNGGGLYLIEKGRARQHPANASLSNQIVLSVRDTPVGLWVGTEKGLFFKAPSPQETPFTAMPDWNKAVLSLFWHRDKLWIGTEGFGLWVKDDLGPTKVPLGQVAGSDMVSSIAVDADGILWIATHQGLFRSSDETATQFEQQQGCDATLITSLWADPQGGVWFGTSGHGLGLFEHGTFHFLDKRHGLISDTILSVTGDAQQGIWLGSNGGIARLTLDNAKAFLLGNEPLLDCETLDDRDGFATVECNGGVSPALWVTREGAVCFPAIGGVLQVSSTIFNQISPERRPRVTLLDAQGNQPGAQTPRLNGTQSERLTFSFQSPYLSHPERIRYAYRLIGYEDAWVTCEPGQTATTYTRLSAGSYTFELKATNPYGRWLKSTASLPFTVSLSFWQSPLFFSLLLAGGIAVLFVITQIRLVTSRRRQRLLQQLIAEKTQHLQQAYQNVKEQHLEVTHLNAALQESNQALQEANRQKDELLGIVAHDLKNPLHVIRGYAELLLQQGIEAKRQNQFLQQIQATADQTIQLTTQLVESSTVESGALLLHWDTHDAIELIHQTVTNLQPLAAAKQQSIQMTLSGNPQMETDPSVFNRILANLLSNAIKFSPFGAPILLDAGIEDESLILKIRDRGPGISSDDLTRLFLKFQRLSAQPTGKESSHGLGLYITQQLVRLHGGRIEVQSVVGQGSSFFVWLPLRQANPTSPT